MQKIRLLYIITKLELGGAQKQLLELIKNLDKETFEILLFTAQDGLLLADFLSITGLKIKKSKWLKRPINPLKDFLAFLEIYQFIKKNNINVVHTHSSKAGILGRLAAKLAKVKIIVHTVHGWPFHDFQCWPLRRFFVWLESISAKFTDRLIVVSEYDKKKGLNNGIGNEEQYRLIRYGIEHDNFKKDGRNIRKEFGLDGYLAVGMISCFKPQKHPEDFIRLAYLVLRQFPSLKFLLIGDGVLRPRIENLINKLRLQDKVILAGWRRDIAEILSALDIFVLTSLWEGLPISVLEAMASAKPVVATNTGGISEVLFEGKTGFLVKPHDMEAMHDKLIVLLREKNIREEMGQNTRNFLGENFSLAKMIDSTRNLYNGLVAGKA